MMQKNRLGGCIREPGRQTEYRRRSPRRRAEEDDFDIEITEEEINAEIESLAKQYELEAAKVKEMVPAEELTGSLKTRKAVKIIVDSAVAVEPAPMKVIGDESAE